MGKKANDREKRRAMVRDRAKRTQANNSGSSFFKLKDGVETWIPDKKATYRINHLPYTVSSENHPDDVPVGERWYKRPFKVHYNVGPEEKRLVCPTSIGKPCPICEHVAKLKKDYEANKDEIKGCKAKNMVAYNIRLADDEDEDKVRLFVWSAFNYSDELEKELIDGDEENCDFFELEDGKTVKVRIAEDSFDSRKFLKADRVDFTSRDNLDEDVMEAVLDLDESLIVLPYEKINTLFYGSDEDGEEDADGDDDEKSSKKSDKKSKTSPKGGNDADDEDEDWDDDDKDDKKSKKGKKPSKKDEDEPEDDDDDAGDDDEPEDDDEEEEEKPSKKTKSSKSDKKSKKDDDEDEPEDDDEEENDEDADDEEEEKPSKKSKSASKDTAKDGKKSSKKGKDADDDWDD